MDKPFIRKECLEDLRLEQMARENAKEATVSLTAIYPDGTEYVWVEKSEVVVE